MDAVKVVDELWKEVCRVRASRKEQVDARQARMTELMGPIMQSLTTVFTLREFKVNGIPQYATFTDTSYSWGNYTITVSDDARRDSSWQYLINDAMEMTIRHTNWDVACKHFLKLVVAACDEVAHVEPLAGA